MNDPYKISYTCSNGKLVAAIIMKTTQKYKHRSVAMLFYVQIFHDQASYGTSGSWVTTVWLPRNKLEPPLLSLPKWWV